MIRRYLLIILFLSLFIGRGFAATYYAKNGTQEWNTTTAWNLTSSAGIGDVAAQPTAGDTIIFDSNYNGTMYVAGNGNSFGGNITSQAGATGSIIHNATKQLYVYGNFTMGNLTYTATANTCLTGFNGNGTITIKDGSLFGNVSFGDYAPSRTYILESNLSLLASNCRVMLTNGTLLLDGATNSSGLTHNWGSFSSSNTNVREINWGNATVNFNDTGTSIALNLGTNLTWTSGNSNINVYARGSSVAYGGSTSQPWYNFSVIGEDTIAAYTLQGSLTVRNSLTLLGNGTNRLRFRTNTLGKRFNVTIVNATFRADNVDFEDIHILNDGVTVDLSANSSGNCGGNENITFTPAQTQTYNSESIGNFSDAALWTSRCPLPQDDIIISQGGVIFDVPNIGRNITVTGSPTIAMNYSTNFIFGSLSLSSGCTLVKNQTLSFKNMDRGTTTYIISSGKSFDFPVRIQSPNSTVQLLDRYYGTSDLSIDNGELDANDFNISTGIYDLDATTDHTFRMGNGNITAIGAGGSLDASPSTNLTIIPEGSTIVLTSNSTSAKNFFGGNLTYNNITYTGGNTGVLAFTGNSTFNNFKLDPSTSNVSQYVNFTSGDTQTVASFSANGLTGKQIIINASTASSPAFLNDLGGKNVLTYCNITDITANATGARWWAFTNDTLVNSTGFITSNPTVTFTNMTLRNITFN